MPHQVCQFHVLRDAIGPAYEADRKVKTAMRKQLQPKLKAMRKQLKQKPGQTTAGEAEQAEYCRIFMHAAASSPHALRRSGRTRDLVIRGTFDRSIAVQHENLVFFAPSSDKWTDAIISNAQEADRGRCCAIKRYVPSLKGSWHGIELLYSLAVDPRPLYAAGFVPAQLFRSLGFLRSSLYRLLISVDGEIQDKSSMVWKVIIRDPYDGSRDIHLGRREEGRRGKAQIQAFKELYPVGEWHVLLENIFAIAEKTLDEELEFMADEAEDAKAEFAYHAAGLRVAHLWLHNVASNGTQKLDNSAAASEQGHE